jgi:hypothetical protein
MRPGTSNGSKARHDAEIIIPGPDRQRARRYFTAAKEEGHHP